MISGVTPGAARVGRFRSRMIEGTHHAVLLLNLQHIRYLVGFTGSDGALLVGDNVIFLLVDGRYVTQAKNETEVEVIEYQDKMDGVAQIAVKSGLKKIGFDPSEIYHNQFEFLKAKLQGIELEPVGKEIETIRCIKDQNEIEQIRKAAGIASSAFLSMLNLIKSGVEERELALELEYKMKVAGAESAAFEVIFASGPNSALPHARPGKRKLDSGDFVVVDYGAKYRGYHSDETCTVGLGDVTKEQELVYSIVKNAHDKGLEKVRSGIACSDIDFAVRSVIDESGYGSFFGHGTGHGVGLDVHEAPRISKRSEMVLETGMVITIEPGIYFPEKWGVRIEDLVLVKQEGCEILSQVPKHLHVI